MNEMQVDLRDNEISCRLQHTQMSKLIRCTNLVRFQLIDRIIKNT